MTLVAAAMVTFSATAWLMRAQWAMDIRASYGVPDSWVPWLGSAKAAGAAGLLVGLAFEPLGVAAAIALLVYFAGAEVTVLRARAWHNIIAPLLFAAPLVAILALY